MGFDQSFIRLHDVPSGRTLGSIDTDDFTVLLGCGVVDLSRPQLTVVGLEGKPDAPEFRLVRMLLGPFRRKVWEVGTVPGSANSPTPDDLLPLLGLLWGDCPTLLLSPALLTGEEAESAYARLLGSLDDGYRLLQAVRRHPADPVGRIRDAGLYRGEGGEPLSPDRALTGDEAEELAGLLLEPVANDRELNAFLGAWDGSVRKRRWDLGLLPFMTMGTREFCSLFSPLLRSCRTPATHQDR